MGEGEREKRIEEKRKHGEDMKGRKKKVKDQRNEEKTGEERGCEKEMEEEGERGENRKHGKERMQKISIEDKTKNKTEKEDRMSKRCERRMGEMREIEEEEGR